jgi:phosphoribosylformimino-5-aminoimidazole carboxamide ribotide isomerase
MRILPVLDIKSGQVVRGIAGRREEYRPIVSTLTASSTPIDVARAFRDHFGFKELYLADLDAIAGAPPALPLYGDLGALGFSRWIDAGIRDEQSVRPLVDAGVESIIAGLETVAGRFTLAAILNIVGPERLVFSLDLRNEKPLAASSWDRSDARAIASEVIDIGVKRVLVLDLARVGTGGGTGTAQLCRWLVNNYPGVEISAGGGVRDLEDLRLMRNCGVQNVLVASTLHDGRIRSSDLSNGY